MDNEDVLMIDCDTCQARPRACSDCVVSVLLGPPEDVEWDATQQRAVDALAEGGIVPRLQLVADRRSSAAHGDQCAG